MNDPKSALKVLVAGVSHGHVDWILARDRTRGDIEIVGIQDANLPHAHQLAAKYNIPAHQVFASLSEAQQAVHPQGILAFGGIDEHLDVVRFAAAHRIPVMLEKPLAHRLEDALEIEKISKQAGIPVFVNYETTWYPALNESLSQLQNGAIGELRQIHFRTGHHGPARIGVKKEFMDWLIHPDRGGGALMDFACYGANILSCLTQGEMPLEVKAETSRFQPQHYPDVEDHATLILRYASGLQATIQASWSWPFSVKESLFYGETGQIIQRDAQRLEAQLHPNCICESRQIEKLSTSLYDDAFSYFAAVVQQKISPAAWDLSSLENSLLVMRILDLAKKEATSFQKP